jgi:hypothetical protein
MKFNIVLLLKLQSRPCMNLWGNALLATLESFLYVISLSINDLRRFQLLQRRDLLLDSGNNVRGAAVRNLCIVIPKTCNRTGRQSNISNSPI